MADAARARWFLPALLGLVVVAIVLRLPELDSGPGYANRDELQYVPKALKYGGGDLNPHFFHNPPLQSYLMFGALSAWYLLGRGFGTFASAADFKAQFLIDASPHFVVARLVVFAIGIALIVHLAYLTRRIARERLSAPDSALAGLLAGVAVTVSPLLIERSVHATNELLVTLAVTLTLHASLPLVSKPTLKRALIAGALVGVSAGAKYTGALAAFAVIAACVAASGISWRRRLTLLCAAGATSLLVFVVTCPWIVLDHDTWRSHIINLFEIRDREHDAFGVLRYLSTAWTEGLGPVWFILTAFGFCSAAHFLKTSRLQGGRETWVAFATAAGVALFICSRSTMAIGRYLMPIYPAFFALAAISVLALRGTLAPWVRRVSIAAIAVWAAVALVQLPGRFERAAQPDSRDVMQAWMAENIPDGAHVITDLKAPWFVPISTASGLPADLPPETVARLSPAYHVSTGYSYWALPLNNVVGTDIPADDFDAIAELGPAYILISDYGWRIWDHLPDANQPPKLWYAKIHAELPEVHRVTKDGRRGPELALFRVSR